VSGAVQERILFPTGTGDLLALDARTGKPIESFGKGGRIDLQEALIRSEQDRRVVGFGSPPIVVNDVIVIGAIITDTNMLEGVPAGHIQAFDVRTGERKWIFRTIPERGEPGSETWEGDVAQYTGGVNAWAPLSADMERGIVYAGTGSSSNDFYGGYRPGSNLFANSLLALEARTGKLLWHFQAVHHDLWDYDFNSAPVLADIVVGGKPISAVAVTSKQGFIYVFDRVTGAPVWPIEERPVPQSRVPGEKTSPTQPFPTKPAPFERQGVTVDDLADFTPAIRAEAEKIASEFVMGGLFEPHVTVGENGKKGTFIVPTPTTGAGGIGGAAFDPETGYLFLQTSAGYFATGIATREPPPDVSATPGARNPDGSPQGVPRYESRSYRPLLSNGLPLLKPPYGSVVAVDLNAGEIVWKVPHGDGPRNHPDLKALNLPRLGALRAGLSAGGPLVTKTLVLFNQIQDASMANGTTGFFLHAFDKRTGELLWEQQMSEPPHGIPMTYEQNGKQYIVVAAGGSGFPAKLVAFAL
jgi:quinoprotein glucose dehydrogenase